MSNKIEGNVGITGARSWLGEATARLLSAQSASVVLGAQRVNRLQSLADELTSSGDKTLATTTDVTFMHTDDALDDQIAPAYHTKYRRYATSTISHIVSPETRSATTKLVPRSRPA